MEHVIKWSLMRKPKMFLKQRNATKGVPLEN